MTDWTTEQILNQCLLVTQARSGTQMLESALKLHPDVVLNSWNGRDGKGIMSLYDFRAMDSETEPGKRFRLTSTHQWGEEFVNNLFSMPRWKFWRVVGYFFPRVVILNRRNQLRRFLSHKVASQVGFGVRVERPWEATVELDIMELVQTVMYVVDNQMSAEKAFPQALLLDYEDLVMRWPEMIGRVQDFMGLETLALAPETHRWETRPIRDIISNWSPALERQLIRLGYGGWLYNGP